MKKFLPWLLVPLAAWLGHRETTASASSSPSAAPPSPSDIRGWVEAKSSAIAGDDLDTLLARLLEPRTPPFTPEKAGEIRLICARLAELDPKEALRRLGEEKPDDVWFSRLLILTEWALLDSDAAWSFIPAGPEGDNDRRAVTGRLLHEDRELFMEWFRRVRQPMPDGDPAWLLVAERYGSELQEIADARLKELENPQEGMRFDFAPLFQLLAKSRAAKDPAGAFEWATGLTPSVRAAALRGVLEAWAVADPMATWAKLLTLDRKMADYSVVGHGENSIGAGILKGIAEKDPAAAMKMLREVTGNLDISTLGGIDVMRSVLSSAVANGEMDPVEAFRLVNSAKGTASNLPLNVVDRMWFGMEPELLEKAARGLLGEPDDGMRDRALAGIAGAWIEADPAAAIAFISGIDDDKIRSNLFAGAFDQPTGGSAQGTRQAEILKQIPEKDRAAVFVSFANQYGNRTAGDNRQSMGGPEIRPDLIAPLLEGLPPSSDLNQAARITALEWGELDPVSALAWAGGLSDTAARSAAYAGAFDGWTYHDPLAAAAWLTEQPAGPDRDAATLPLVRRLGASDPENAWDWAGVIGQPDLQTEARLSALKSWAGQAPDAARAAYQDYLSTLPPAEAAKFAERYSAK